MHLLLESYARLLETEGCVLPGRVALAGLNDSISSIGPNDLRMLAESIIARLQVAAVVVAEPAHPFSELLLQRAPAGETLITPRDSESRSSLHDIPLIPATAAEEQVESITKALSRRKGCIVQSTGMISQGAMTVEQAYIAWSSLFHATTIKYLEDLLSQGLQLPGEAEMIRQTLSDKAADYAHDLPVFEAGPFQNSNEIINNMAIVGRAMVQRGLVDSFFGNISYRSDDALYISQTAARLDQLDHQIDRIPFDNSSTAGITASSELPAHRAIGAATGCRAILHGHPRFPVVLGFFTEPTEHEGIDSICGIPVVGGEGGLGGLAETVPMAFKKTGAAAVIVRGHGVFSIARDDFREAFAAMLAVEESCCHEFRRRLKALFKL